MIMVVAPVHLRERVETLDVLRGFALLGILAMNIQLFAMPGAAYFNPMAYGGTDAANLATWAFVHLLFDQKFMTIFSILFGAGVLLFTERLEAKGLPSAGLHYRRTGWLLVFGLAHAYLLWYGDILVTYAVCALLLYFFRRASPRRLLTIAAVVLTVPPLLFATMGLTLPTWDAAMRQDALDDWAPSEELVAAETDAYRGGWLEQMGARIEGSLATQTFYLPIWLLWRAGGLMLVGMALYKWGVLSGRREPAFYARMAKVGLGVGYPIVAAGILAHFLTDFSFEASFFLFLPNYFGSILVSLGYIGAVTWLFQAGAAAGLMRRFSAVGRTAFTNYLLQSIVCSFIFYGHGLGLFGSIDRVGQVLIFLAIILAQLALVPVWVRNFQYGPFEWAWRSLTYAKIQPLRGPQPAAVAGAPPSAAGGR